MKSIYSMLPSVRKWIRKHVICQVNLNRAGGKICAYLCKMKHRKDKPETGRIGYLKVKDENEWEI